MMAAGGFCRWLISSACGKCREARWKNCFGLSSGTMVRTTFSLTGKRASNYSNQFKRINVISLVTIVGWKGSGAMRVTALIPAAGMGKRMGAGINKQYLHLAGKPILAHTLAVFEAAPFVDDVYLIIPHDEIAYCRENVVERYGFNKVRKIVPGGSERQHSVRNGLLALDLAADDIVIIHDGVRPFVPVAIIEQSVATARSHDGALVAVPVKDTVKVVRDGLVLETPPRETLWLAQTPQTFRYGIIRDAYEAAEDAGWLGTDDASLVERLGKSVRIVPGVYGNFKITTPEDLVLAEAFLREAGCDASV
jgi:2-C-methyl-D-erythritol 4-phosphate cytidylyltransferase